MGMVYDFRVKERACGLLIFSFSERPVFVEMGNIALYRESRPGGRRVPKSPTKQIGLQ